MLGVLGDEDVDAVAQQRRLVAVALFFFFAQTLDGARLGGFFAAIFDREALGNEATQAIKDVLLHLVEVFDHAHRCPAQLELEFIDERIENTRRGLSGEAFDCFVGFLLEHPDFAERVFEACLQPRSAGLEVALLVVAESFIGLLAQRVALLIGYREREGCAGARQDEATFLSRLFDRLEQSIGLFLMALIKGAATIDVAVGFEGLLEGHEHFFDEGVVALLDPRTSARRDVDREGPITIGEVVQQDDVGGGRLAARLFFEQLPHRRRATRARSTDDKDVEAAFAQAEAELECRERTFLAESAGATMAVLLLGHQVGAREVGKGQRPAQLFRRQGLFHEGDFPAAPKEKRCRRMAAGASTSVLVEELGVGTRRRNGIAIRTQAASKASRSRSAVSRTMISTKNSSSRRQANNDRC